MRWVGHAAGMRYIRNTYKYLKGTGPLRKAGVYRRIMPKCILKKHGVRGWTGFNWLRMEPSHGLLRTR